MVICNTTISIDISVSQEWKNWMNETYIPLLKNTGSFIDVRLFAVQNDQDEGGITFALMMMSRDLSTYKDFEAKTLEKCIDKSLLFDHFVREWLKNNQN